MIIKLRSCKYILVQNTTTADNESNVILNKLRSEL